MRWLRWRFLAALVVPLVGAAIYMVMFDVYSVEPEPRLTEPLLYKIHDIWIATDQFVGAHGKYPDLRNTAAFQRDLSPYYRDSWMLKEPGGSRQILLNAALAGKKPDKLWAGRGQIVLVYARTNNRDRPYVAIKLDGTARKYSVTDWNAVKAQSRIL